MKAVHFKPASRDRTACGRNAHSTASLTSNARIDVTCIRCLRSEEMGEERPRLAARFDVVRLDPEGWTVLAPPITFQGVEVRLHVVGHPPGEAGARAVAAALNAAIGAIP